MRSIKRIALLAIAAALALAVVVPAVASASRLESKKGTLAPAGALLTATSHNVVIQSTIGNFGCDAWSLPDEVTKNDGMNFESRKSGEGQTSNCFIAGSTPLTFLAASMDLHSTKSGTGTASLTFTVYFPGATCRYYGEELPFTYQLGSSSIQFTKAPLHVSPAACFGGTFNATFQLTIGSTPVILN